MSERPNVPPADEYAAIKTQIRALEERQDQLRKLLLADPSARTGNQFAIMLREVTSQRVDLKELRAAYPDETDEHTYPNTVTHLVVQAITDDGELIPARAVKR